MAMQEMSRGEWMIIQHRTEAQIWKDAFKNGYDIAMEDVENTLKYINYRLAEIAEFDKKKNG
jgi:hypothetical protein